MRSTTLAWIIMCVSGVAGVVGFVGAVWKLYPLLVVPLLAFAGIGAFLGLLVYTAAMLSGGDDWEGR